MKTISITDEQSEALCRELACLINEFRKDPRVHCIYGIPYQKNRSAGSAPENRLDLTVVHTGLPNSVFLPEIEKYNKMYGSSDSIEKFGLQIHMNGDAAYLYDCFDKKRCKQLYFSTVFYLKTSDLKQLKKDARSMEINGVSIPNSRLMNLAQIQPPITDDKVFHQLLLINDEEELKLVKEFTKTKTFNYIKNM